MFGRPKKFLLSVAATNAIAIPTAFQLTIPQSRYVEIDVSAAGFSSFLFQTPITVTTGHLPGYAGAN
jgi:hypothetical protein